MWHNKIVHYLNCKRVAPTSVLPFCVTAVLPHDGRNYWPEHVVNTMNNEQTSCIVMYYSEDQYTNTDILQLTYFNKNK